MTETTPRKVFIADDNTEFANFVASVARRSGWKAEICGDGKQLLQSLQREDRPALLFIDINMPNMDGIEAVEQIVSLERPFRVRFVTGGQDAPILAAKLIARAHDIPVGKNLYKPLPLEALTRVLRDESVELDGLEGAGEIPATLQ